MATKVPNLNISGIKNFGAIHYNLSYDELYQHELKNNEVIVTSNGTASVDTGKFTGRSPKDKFFVKQSPSDKNIWWGSVNHEMSPEVFEELYQLTIGYIDGKDMYVTDAYCGADKSTRLGVRVISQFAWQSHFCKNMFIGLSQSEAENFNPDFTILNASHLSDAKWKEHGLNSEVFVIFNIEKKLAIIGGTSYAGEMKKGMFSMMNYFLPLQGIMSMHCSANVGKNGDTSLFFGLSGTGKTTLSTDPNRALVGDDEHGWNDNGIFNFEGGCYAKTIKLSPKTEPDIYQAIRCNALLENVMIDPVTKVVDYDDFSKTENGRASYPLNHIDNIVKPVSIAGHPNHVIFLTCDAYGVLPPVSKLEKEQAIYHFISGYTAKVAGTERGITEPQATFSACFGGPFMTLHPHVYAKLLGDKISRHNVSCWLVNTGWTGGSYGVGKRMDLPGTRKIITAILENELSGMSASEFQKEEIFGLMVPKSIKGVDAKLLSPIESWADKAKYIETATKLARMFVDNYAKFKTTDMDYSSAGPKV